MDQGMVLLSVVIGLFLRLGLPILLTVLAILWLKKLDQQWQDESKKISLQSIGLPGVVSNPGCWKTKGCAETSFTKCAAYLHPETPCWQLFRDHNGRLRDGCIDCQIFREAPIPAIA